MRLPWNALSGVTAGLFTASGSRVAETGEAAPAVDGTRLWTAVHQGTRWLQKTGFRPLFPTRSRRLRVTETVQLGEKRFLSIVQVDGMEYLVGGGTAHVALLTRLGAAPPVQTAFDQAMDDAWRQRGAAF